MFAPKRKPRIVYVQMTQPAPPKSIERRLLGFLFSGPVLLVLTILLMLALGALQGR
jgi:hypothetical protein